MTVMSGRDGRAEEVEGEAGGSRHTQCMEMHCNFCLKILLFCFSKNVSVCYQSSFHHLLSFQCPYHRRIHAIQESKAALSPQNASARLSNVNLFSGTASSTSCSSSSSSGSAPLISIKSYSVNSSAVGSAAAAKLLQSCPTLCDPIDGSSLGSPVPGILQARTLEWVAISFSNA